MVMTRPGNGVHEHGEEALGPVARRPIDRRPGLPGARAIVGGLLIAVAGVCTFVAWRQATGAPDQSFAVAARPIDPGEPLTAADLRFVSIELPATVAGAAFTDPSAVEGRVALGPIGEGELVQVGQVSDAEEASPVAELSFSIARDRAVDGRLRSGDLVDVFVTDEEGTTSVAEAMQIVEIGERDEGSFGTTGELTVTLAVTDRDLQEPLIQAVREGEVTLVRTTHLATGTGG
jgi:Flp pilus assembly protein CpaB